MITLPDFNKKQIVFVFFSDGDKLSVSNDNLIVKDVNGKVKCQCSCYRLFLVFAIGNVTITSPLIQKAYKFGFFIALMSAGFRINSIIGACKDSNTLLRRKQYAYSDMGIAKVIIENKISNQLSELKSVRNKNSAIKDAITHMQEYKDKVGLSQSITELMAYEGLSSKIYFRNHFNNVYWQGRQPRIKRDYVNSSLDIGYTLLFAFIEALLLSYGFDVYCGVMHKEFYMRKSLVCDIVEPFRPIIDHELKKGINLKQIKKEDFAIINHQYRLKWSESTRYVKLFMTPIIENKDIIFSYIQKYYRAFMKELDFKQYPMFDLGEVVW